ncbi:MAG: glycosyltransferase family 1 protein [Chitinophagaceae bacterium]
MPRKEKDVFGSDACYITQHSFQKYLPLPNSGIDLWHCTYQGSNYFPRNKSPKILLTVHDLNFMYDKKKGREKQKKHLLKLQQQVEAADEVVAISHFVKQEIEMHCARRNTPIRVIHNGSNVLSHVTPVKPSSFSIPPSFIFTIGTIAVKKNFHVLPAALVHNRHHLVIAGIAQDKEYVARIFREADRLNVRDRVHYVGAVSEAEKYWLLRECALFAFPSLAEGFGLPVIEAMHFGKPVLLSTTTSLPEVGGPQAEYLQDFSAAEVQYKTEKAMADFSPEKAILIQEWAAQYNWKHAAHQYWDVYKRMLYE